MKNILIIGATSAMIRPLIRKYAEEKNNLCLVGRNAKELEVLEKDLKIRGAEKVSIFPMDLNDTEKHPLLIEFHQKELGRFDIVLVAYGHLGRQEAAIMDFHEAALIINTNFLSVVSLLTLIANECEKQNSGQIAVISSVAGDRGRQSNYVYGSAKGALSIFLSGLRQRLYPFGVQVLDIKPGFVDTPMTREFKKGLLWAKPERISAGIQKAIAKRKDTVYLPSFWFFIMSIIKCIPTVFFKRIKL